MILCGSSGSGKSTFVKKLFENSHNMFDHQFERILWCYGEPSAKPDLPGIEYSHGVPENIENHSAGHMLLIIDDLMTECYTKQLSDLFTRGSHHQLISVMILNQVLFPKNAFARTISLNTKYLVCFKSPRDKKQFEYLAFQVFPESPKALVKVYNEVTAKAYSYFILDFSQAVSESLRYRADIFNPFYSAICYVDLASNNGSIQTETIEGEQVYVTYT